MKVNERIMKTRVARNRSRETRLLEVLTIAVKSKHQLGIALLKRLLL